MDHDAFEQFFVLSLLLNQVSRLILHETGAAATKQIARKWLPFEYRHAQSRIIEHYCVGQGCLTFGRINTHCRYPKKKKKRRERSDLHIAVKYSSR